MLVTMLTAMYMMVRVAEQLGVRWVRQQQPLPYMVSQPLPWQVHYVSHSRKGSLSKEFEGQRRNSIGVYRKSSSSSNGHTKTSADKAAATIQNQYRKYHQKKQKDHK
ncbi:uncharacterized protein LOC132108463 [Carassius carassius]|uniref:uncharacterized protein LOC132108463 n=1 Tax=Carassius carassius TaxID=217509 RepID=UPI0028684936|nr:uncharacterized protein LOC132108463 [Carassius carassius]